MLAYVQILVLVFFKQFLVYVVCFRKIGICVKALYIDF